MNVKITTEHLKRRAIVYIRQSSLTQVLENLESKQRQYNLANKAKEYGFSQVEVIDEDLGRSGAGTVERPGFSRMLMLVCEGGVGAIFCIEASRLARNGRDWHHLIDLCSLVKTLIIDPEGVYDPLIGNDRLLLGLKGTMSEFELSLFKQRSIEALRQKAIRGELKFCLPIGFCWTRNNKIELEPNKRVQEAIKLVFKKFIELRSARQVLLWFREESISLPRISYNEFGQELLWQLPIYKNILSILKNPFYAGAYAFGKTESRTKIVEGRARKNRGHRKPMEQWLVLIKNHHTGYILWERFEENQKILSDNAHMQSTDSPKSGRGGKALLTGLLRCGHCGRMLHLTYCGTAGNVARYYCRGAHINYGRERCISFGNLRADEAISLEILKAVENDAIEAAFKAAEQVLQQREDHRKALLLELEQAHYEKNLACRRYEAVDPNNRLVADELEIRWNQALQRVKEVEDGLKKLEDIQQKILLPDHTTFLYLAKDLSTVWNSASTGIDLKQRILRLLICEIIATVDKIKNEIILIIHWKGGRHSELRIHKNRTGHHGRSNSMEAVEIIAQMATKFSDKIIASTLNRLGLKTGTGNSWNQSRVRSVKNYQSIRTYNTNMKHINVTLTLRDTAKELGVSQSTIRRLIKYKIITAQQIVNCAPWQIEKSELEKESVQKVIKAIQNGKKIPWSLSTNKENLMLFSL
ncbi:MAG: recombinase family protein [Rickettsiaceae bacterium]|nr:recombinase family protein [Rickettsiaceae bacterium]